MATPILIALGLFAALLIAGGIASDWETILLWRNQVAFGWPDPVFGRDIGFFLFDLPKVLLPVCGRPMIRARSACVHTSSPSRIPGAASSGTLSARPIADTSSVTGIASSLAARDVRVIRRRSPGRLQSITESSSAQPSIPGIGTKARAASATFAPKARVVMAWG